MSAQASANALARGVEQATHVNADLCYQCLRCSAGCPMAAEYDVLPSEIMLAIQEGDASVVDSRAVWLCASCQTCSTRCPQGLDIPGIIDHFRQQTVDRACVPESARFFKTFLRNAQLFGRVYEAGMMGELNLREGKPFRDLGMGLRMFKKGKIRLLPDYARPVRSVTREEPAPNKVAYYPGCSLHSTGAAFDRSFRAVAGSLGLDLREMPGWTCCGATPAHGVDAVKAVSMPLRNLVIAEQMGLDRVVAPCAACYSRFKSAARHYQEDGPLAERVDADSGQPYGGGVEVLNAMDCLQAVGSEAIAAKVVRPLKGLKIACYYGCLLTRPPADTGSAEPENPTEMERLVRLLGAEPVDWGRKTDCCGGSLAVSHTALAKRMTAQVLTDARDHGADLVAVACPLCQINLDERQPEMAADLGFTLPVLYVTQLMALALDLPATAQALELSAVAPQPVLQSM
ncbi:MAG: heterodisulfide reductase-related iron-sulfur binding cluster [Deferrisomatales bacterium]|nr:heterodisulfide reductase-related iron-sulfur binding cluster [Deferrisomatales bacterium]